MDDQFHDLQCLLRLKRYEAPPLDHHEDFMREFHRRQREEMLRRPIWRLALDRIEAALPVFAVPRYTYAGACTAALLVAGLISGRILTMPAADGSRALAHHGLVQASQPSINIYQRPSAVRLAPELNFDSPRRVATAAVAPGVNRTRYVLDAQPVSYGVRSDF